MCGIFGIQGQEGASHLTYLGLYALQHRGQESAGLVAWDGKRMAVERGMGEADGEAVGALVREDSAWISTDVRMYLRDTSDHIKQVSEAIDSAREVISGLMSTYLSVVGQRTNDVMKTLTIVASIFVPLTFIAGLYGMNFEHMPELGVRWAYPATLAAMLVLGLGMVAFFWRKGWFDG